MSTHPQTWYYIPASHINIKQHIMHTLAPYITVSPFSTKTNTKPIQPTQNSNTLYQHQPNLATPMISTYTTFLKHAASTLISWLHHHHPRRFIRQHNMPRCWIHPITISIKNTPPYMSTRHRNCRATYWWHGHHISHANTYSICTMSHNQLHQ